MIGAPQAGCAPRGMSANSLRTGRGMSVQTNITVGICAMDKKAEGKPMKELMKRLEYMGPIKFVRFGDELLTNAPVSVLKAPARPCVDPRTPPGRSRTVPRARLRCGACGAHRWRSGPSAKC